MTLKSFEEYFIFLGKTHSLNIVDFFMINQKVSYSDILKNDPNINHTLLSERLKQMIELKLIHRDEGKYIMFEDAKRLLLRLDIDFHIWVF